MTLQLILSSTSDGIVASARAAVSDPDATLNRVEFYTTVLPSGPRLGPFAPVATTAFGVYEKDLLLDLAAQTKIEAIAVLTDGTSVVATPPSVTVGQRSSVAPAPSIRSLNLLSQWWSVNVSIVPGSAYSWKCWLRRDAWPTVDNTPSGAVVESYLRFEGNRDELAFALPIPGGGAGTWCAIAIGYGPDGAAGARLADVVDGTYDGPVREALVPAVLQVDGIEQRQTEMTEKLKVFTDWLTANSVRGIISEVGWPWEAVDAWNQVAQAWFSLANQNLLWVIAWAVGEKWGTYPLQPYALENGSYVRKPQADILEAAANLTITGNYKRGVNCAGAEFGAPVTEPTCTFSNVNRGASPSQYQWNGLATYQYMFSRGHRLARIPFRWERIQPVLGQPLDAAELQRMRDSVSAAQQAGLEIVLDVHNYGAYWLDSSGSGVRYSIGTPQVTFDHFADLWTRLAQEFNAYPGVIGYGLMNEPVNMTGVAGKTAAETWEIAAQRAADAIRSVALPNGASHRWIIVGGYQWSGTWSPGVNHRGPFVTDAPVNKVMYEAHQYFDFDSSGKYSTHELNPVQQENWIRWEPNVAMWDIANDLGDGKEVYSVEVYRAGLPAPLDIAPVWKRSVMDAPVFPCPPNTGCGHKTYEYRVVVIDTRDGSQRDYAASISGSYQ
ncbi:MAG TPA: cellulase family glycosylhydrolase [Gemmatimonadaceae bacterium]|jgi:hypothetical protein|nr:cellulase family glycosylhydrolase [Gemmatimonadaceae bacterium]